MGRFYQTAEPTFVDNKMFEAPHELMRQVLLGKDKAIDDKISDAVSFYDKLTADVLQQDTPRAKEIIKGYEQQINDVVAGIQKNPLEYNKYSSTIRDLGRNISKDWTMGEIGNMQQYKKNVLTEYDKLDKHLKENPQDAEYVAKEKAAILAKYQGINWNKELMKPGASPDIQESYFALDFNLDDYLKNKMEADGYSKEWDTHSGGYIYRHKQTGETLSEEKAALAAKSYFDANPQIQKAVERRGVLGMQDFMNANLENALSKDEKGNLVYGDDYYAKNIKSAALHRTFKNTSTSDTMHTDEPYWKKKQRSWELEDKEAEKEQQIGLTQESLYDHKLYDGNAITSDLTNTNISLTNSNKEFNNIANQYKTAFPNNKAIYAGILKGDKNAMNAAVEALGIDGTRVNNLIKEREGLNIKKKILNKTLSAFKEDLIKSGDKNSAKLVGTAGWSKNPKLIEKYNQYTTKKGVYGNPFTTSTKEVSFRGIDINPATQKALLKKTEENILNLQFTPQNTVSGQETSYEDANGNQVVFINKNSNIKAGTYDVKNKPGKKITYLKTDKFSMEELVNRGLAKIVTSVNKETGESKTEIVTRKNGQKVGFVINPTSFGVVHGLDRNGKNNFGMKLQSGSNFIDAEIPIEQYRLPDNIKNSITANNEDWQEANYQQFDWKLYGRESVDIPNYPGAKFIIDNDKVYYNGVKVDDKEMIFLARKLALRQK